jgi:hypothetical protein
MMMKKQQAIVLGLVTLGFGTELLLPRLSGHLLYSAGEGARISSATHLDCFSSHHLTWLHASSKDFDDC